MRGFKGSKFATTSLKYKYKMIKYVIDIAMQKKDNMYLSKCIGNNANDGHRD